MLKPIGVIALGCFCALSLGLHVRIAAGAPLLEVNDLHIDGGVSFPPIQGGPPSIFIPFLFTAPRGETSLQVVNAAVPPGGPPGAPPLLAAVSTGTTMAIVGNDIVQQSTFKIQCTFPLGCGPAAIGFAVTGVVKLRVGEQIKGIEFRVSDLSYTGDTAVPSTLRFDFVLEIPGDDVVLGHQEQVLLTQQPVQRSLPQDYNELLQDLEYEEGIPFFGSMFFESESSVRLGSLLSEQTFEFRITTGPVEAAAAAPAPATLSLLGLGLAGLGFARRSVVKRWASCPGSRLPVA